MWEWLSQKNNHKALGSIGAIFAIIAVALATWIGFQQNRISRSLLELNFTPSVEIVYDQSVQRLNVFNKGRENVFVSDAIFDEEFSECPSKNTPSKETRLVTPGGYYYFLTEGMVECIAEQYLKKGVDKIPFDILIQSATGKKYVAKNLFFINGVHSIHTQTISIIKSEW